MHYGCFRQCPKVREQLRKAREEAREETDDEDLSSDSNLSEAAGPSTGQKPKNGFSTRSKQSSRYPSGAASPTKTVGSPRRSEHILARGSPVRSPDASRKFDPERRSYHRRSKESERTKGYPSSRAGPGESPNPSRRFDPERRSQRRSKESQRSKGYPSGRVSQERSADPSRRFDPERRSNRRSHESERARREQQLVEKKNTETSPKSLRNGRKDPDEYKSGTSSRSDTGERIPDYVRGLKRGAVEKIRGKTREADDEEEAGPSRKTRAPRDDEEGDDEESEDDSQKASISAYDVCGPHCRGLNERMRSSKNDKQQEEFDEYLLYKNLPYFNDLCNCCYQCLAKQLWNDSFVKSTVASVAVFALGLKLCWELDGWTVPNTF